MTRLSRLPSDAVCSVKDYEEVAVAYTAICLEEPKKTTKNTKIAYIRSKI
jgi:hypothetical protein